MIPIFSEETGLLVFGFQTLSLAAQEKERLVAQLMLPMVAGFGMRLPVAPT